MLALLCVAGAMAMVVERRRSSRRRTGSINATAHPSKTKVQPQGTTRVYLFLGLGNVFSTGIDVLAEKLARRQISGPAPQTTSRPQRSLMMPSRPIAPSLTPLC